ncbi:MAG: YggT family protein [Patescibacteria group bacterium]
MDKIIIIDYLANFIVIFKNILVYALIARILVSWFVMNETGPRNRIVQFLYDVTDPVLNLARRLPHRISMIDLSPMIAILGVDLLGYLIVTLLFKLV